MQGSLYWTADAIIYQTANAGPFLGDSGCRRYSIKPVNAGISLSDCRCGCRTLSNSQRVQDTLMRPWMQKFHYQTADAGLYRTADAGDTIRQKKQESPYHSDNRCCNRFIGQRMQEKLYQTADAEDTLSGCGYRIHSLKQQLQESHIRQPMQESLYRQRMHDIFH